MPSIIGLFLSSMVLADPLTEAAAGLNQRDYIT